MRCRGCKSEKLDTFVNLGFSPISNDLLSQSALNDLEPYFPLHTKFCHNCTLVQLPEITDSHKLFKEDYVYYSSYSKSWLDHAQSYANAICQELHLKPTEQIIEIASNDGYLLQFFLKMGIQVLGVEPALKVAQYAIKEKKVPTEIDFFGVKKAQELRSRGWNPRLIIGNNVLAHVPDLSDFVEGLSILADENSVINLEFPHLYELIKNNQFDTIYHEHFSYLNLTSIIPLFESHQLTIFKVEKINTHGGSLRIYAAKKSSKIEIDNSILKILDIESKLDPRDEPVRSHLNDKVRETKLKLLQTFTLYKQQGKSIAAYGAAAKGNTLLNFCGVKSDFIDYVVDLNPNKQNMYMPGSHIPIVDLSHLTNNPPDLLIILPWNLSFEIVNQIKSVIPKSTRILRAIPEVEYLS